MSAASPRCGAASSCCALLHVAPPQSLNPTQHVNMAVSAGGYMMEEVLFSRPSIPTHQGRVGVKFRALLHVISYTTTAQLPVPFRGVLKFRLAHTVFDA